MRTHVKHRVGLICLLALMVIAVAMVGFGSNIFNAYAHAESEISSTADLAFFDSATGMRTKHTPEVGIQPNT